MYYRELLEKLGERFWHVLPGANVAKDIETKTN